MLNNAVEALAAHVDIIEFCMSLVGSIVCIYLIQVILKEKAPWISLQRWALGFLAIAMFANGVTEYAPWNLVEGVYRPTGVIVYTVLVLNLLVMAARGRVMRQDHDHYDQH
jgi:hypothetical protein